MLDLTTRTPLPNVDYTTRDYDGFKNLMINELKRRVPEYADFSENDLGIVLIELLSLGQDIQSYYIDKIANESLLSTAMERQNVVELCANIDYTLSNATPSVFQQVFHIEPSEGETVIPQGFAITTKDNGFDEVLTFETVEEFIIPPNCTGLEQGDEGQYLYTVDVVQGKTIQEELLGTSSGLPNQEFKLWESPVIASQVEVFVNDGNGFKAWTYVPSFLQSKSDDTHFSIKMDGSSSATIVFGNGTLGAIPPVYEDNIIAKYRVGGGTKGNVIPKIITEMVQPLAFIKETYNPYQAKVWGKDVESIETARRNAIIGLRTLERAVTLQDFKDIGLKEFDYLLLSDAYEEDDGVTVTVYFASSRGTTLSVQEKEEIQEFYNRVRLTGIKPVIKDATYVPLDFRVTVYKHPKDNMDYEHLIPSIVEDYLKIGNLDFRQRFRQSALLKQLMLILPNAEDIDITLTSVPKTLVQGEIYVKGNIQVEVITNA